MIPRFNNQAAFSKVPSPLTQKSTMASHAMVSYVLSFVLLATYICGAAATDYTVGDDGGWTIGTNYLTWSTKYNFTVGDALSMKLKSHPLMNSLLLSIGGTLY
jgi:hypothetical protein